MGEEAIDRVDMLVTLANLPDPSESVPLARIMMPKSHVRLSAGRTAKSDEMQALCFSPAPIRCPG